MGIMKRENKLAKDSDGILWGTIAFILFPSILTLTTFAYETTTETPIISPETSPTLAGIGLDYLWVIFALMTIITIFVYIAFGRAKPRNN